MTFKTYVITSLFALTCVVGVLSWFVFNNQPTDTYVFDTSLLPASIDIKDVYFTSKDDKLYITDENGEWVETDYPNGISVQRKDSEIKDVYYIMVSGEWVEMDYYKGFNDACECLMHLDLDPSMRTMTWEERIAECKKRMLELFK
jgi:hypothetical protein